MFCFREILSKYNGRAFTPEGLKKLMKKIRIENLRDIPPEFGTSDLICCAQHKGWVRKNRSNKQRQIIVRVC